MSKFASLDFLMNMAQLTRISDSEQEYIYIVCYINLNKVFSFLRILNGR